MEESKARRVVAALRERGVPAHLERPGVYQFGVAVQLSGGRRAVWDADSADELSATVVRNGVLVGFVPVLRGSGALDEAGLAGVIAATDYDAPPGPTAPLGDVPRSTPARRGLLDRVRGWR